MKAKLTLIMTLMATLTYGQPYTNDDFIQNFYVSCKAGAYVAFLALQKGTELLETGQYNRSIKSYINALEKDSNCCDAYYMLAFCNQRQADYQLAIENCDKSLKLNENNPSAWVVKGTTLLLLKDTINALYCFENVKKYAPNQIDGYYGISLIYFYQNKVKESLLTIEQFESNSNSTALSRDQKKMKNLKKKLVEK